MKTVKIDGLKDPTTPLPRYMQIPNDELPPIHSWEGAPKFSKSRLNFEVDEKDVRSKHSKLKTAALIAGGVALGALTMHQAGESLDKEVIPADANQTRVVTEAINQVENLPVKPSDLTITVPK